MAEESISTLTDEVTRMEVARQKATDVRDNAKNYYTISIVVTVLGAVLFVLGGFLNPLVWIILVAGIAGILLSRESRNKADAEITRLNGQILDRRDRLAQALGEAEPAAEAAAPAEAEAEAKK
jgi:Flp pilus assembly protein TadB